MRVKTLGLGMKTSPSMLLPSASLETISKSVTSKPLRALRPVQILKILCQNPFLYKPFFFFSFFAKRKKGATKKRRRKKHTFHSNNLIIIHMRLRQRTLLQPSPAINLNIHRLGLHNQNGIVREGLDISQHDALVNHALGAIDSLDGRDLKGEEGLVGPRNGDGGVEGVEDGVVLGLGADGLVDLDAEGVWGRIGDFHGIDSEG